MSEILKEILSKIPEGKISDAGFEGANIVLYTKDKDFFFDNKGIIKEIVNSIKKRIELRPDPAIVLELEKSEKMIKKIIPKEAGMSDVIFDPQRSRVVVHAEKPGLVIGKQGEILREIREKTLWVPIIKRTPPLRCKLIEGIRSVLYENSDYRRKFLNKTGHRIYDGWIRGKKNEWVRLSYLGGGRQVGRSCILLQTPESRVLLDCGINIANDSEAYPFLEAPEFKIEELDAVIISHAHLDHSGFLPYLYKFGYRGPVYCTAPTRDIMSLLHLDLVKIMRNEGKDPIYTSDEIKEMVKHTICLGYEEVTDITPDVRITLYNAGHMLGSSLVHIHVGNGLHNMVYTADLKYGKTMLLEPAETKFPRLETLMIESTYGARDNVMPPAKEQDELLKEIITNTLKRGGKVLMPTLGSGRAQEVMILIEALVQEGKIDTIPVYVDGMVWDITAIHTAYPEFLNRNIRKQIFHKDNNPFLSPIFKEVGSAKERKQIIESGGPCVVIATSGMLVGGPSVEYLKALHGDKKNSLVFSCYQAEGSLGHRIRRGDREIVMSHDPSGRPDVMKINMEVFKIEITGHSDRKELMNYVSRCNPRPKKVIINHGENSRCLDLASSIHRQFRIETQAPRNLESIRVK
ncbi:beta-CASP ribonuclease aCPSF1 [Candidatus Woesearchaeota archaeon]|nr:beta-CASP ribonuclease aCPSF1 [Candidatus Woesearchaeota archaeon]MBT7367665.1 beta-CASP ribonuclease aCPSF1 [Candidatus Woesearchaeota archaeon]